MTKRLPLRAVTAPMLALAAGLASMALAGCMSTDERQMSDARGECAAKGLAPNSGAYVDCVDDAANARRVSERSQSDRMQQENDASMESFLHSQSYQP